ncbi:hypothetical protein ODDIEODDIE_64 [Escherichia phage vB_EcoS_OddieOddie]|nr:hypothetical protein ODDIEODDIE_64 [Escherichia phage vB_EcoS_OddieOddie]
MATIDPFMKKVNSKSACYYFGKSLDINGYVVEHVEGEGYILYIKVLDSVEYVNTFASKQEVQDTVDTIKAAIISMLKLACK